MGGSYCSQVKRLTRDSSQKDILLSTLISSLAFPLAGKGSLEEWSHCLPQNNHGFPDSGEAGIMLIPQIICTGETGTWACEASWMPT